jgi:hypothetical protein
MLAGDYFRTASQRLENGFVGTPRRLTHNRADLRFFRIVWGTARKPDPHQRPSWSRAGGHSAHITDNGLSGYAGASVMPGSGNGAGGANAGRGRPSSTTWPAVWG